MDDSNKILIHHGIEGQKWGVRRYQNPDGTLTAEGRKRYRVEERYDRKNINKAFGRAKYASAAASLSSHESTVAYEKAMRAKTKSNNQEKISRLEKNAKERKELAKRAANEERRALNDLMRISKKYADKYGSAKIKDLTVDKAVISDSKKAANYIAMKGTAPYYSIGFAGGMIGGLLGGSLGGSIAGGIKAYKNVGDYNNYLNNLSKGRNEKFNTKAYETLYGDYGERRYTR